MTMVGLTYLFADIPAGLPEELIQPLLSKRGLRIERIVSPATPRPKASGTTKNGTNGSRS